jgi:serine/threonine protein kinase
MIGQKLGQYQIVDEIGTGSMAAVYKAYDPSFDRLVAIKTMHRLYTMDPSFQERFDQEARAIAMLEHLHILPVYAYGQERGITYLVMRYLKSGTLADLIQQGPLPLGDASRLLAQMASALDYAHQHGVLHRDVKPPNVLLDEHENTYLADFGIALLLRAPGSEAAGTPMYMSPEQGVDTEKLTAAADQYSLGVILYEMIAGRPPFTAAGAKEMVRQHIYDPVPPPRQFRSELSELTENVILKALSKRPHERFPTCSDFADAFAQAIAGRGLQRLEKSTRIPEELHARIDSALAEVQVAGGEGEKGEEVTEESPEPPEPESPESQQDDWIILGDTTSATTIGAPPAPPVSPRAIPGSGNAVVSPAKTGKKRSSASLVWLLVGGAAILALVGIALVVVALVAR